MQFISYAKNCVDVVLWRAFQKVSNGFYVDVGANSSSSPSVTKAFYNLGWRGITLATSSEISDQLKTIRPRDTNLTIGDREDIARIWFEHRELEQPVHFMHIAHDCIEKVLHNDCSNHWQTHRPWVLLVDSGPYIANENPTPAWEHRLLESDYRFVYTDGIHRLYLAVEHQPLLGSLTHPPNIFDSFRLGLDPKRLITDHASDQRSTNYFQQLITAREIALNERARARVADSERATARADASSLSATLQTIYASKSWRVTHPLRVVITYFSIKLPSKTRGTLRGLLSRLSQFAYSHPAVANALKRILNRAPSLKQKLMRMAGISAGSNLNTGGVIDSAQAPVELSAMPVRAQQIYADLRAAIERKNKD